MRYTHCPPPLTFGGRGTPFLVYQSRLKNIKLLKLI
uniref:Uncharacterized protein n=1 Tax=Manihot esculenta TaxID=3983 RepID=A0A2C9VT13_MANES